MISELLERIFSGNKQATSGQQVKQRLKFILAHDRAAISPQMFEMMRKEIMDVVSKYVELDREALDIRLESDNRMTVVVANLPIVALRADEPQTPAPEPDFEVLTISPAVPPIAPSPLPRNSNTDQ